MEPSYASPSSTSFPYAGGEGATSSAAEPTLAERTRRLASDARRRAGSQVRTELDTGKQRAADALHDVADSLLNGTRDVTDGPSRYLRDASEQVRRAADWIEHSDIQDLTMRAEEFARRQPALFLGGAFTLGLVAARFFKSSNRGTSVPRRYEPTPMDPLGFTDESPQTGRTHPPYYAGADMPSAGEAARDGGL